MKVYDRSYYAGFLGRWEPEGKTVFVCEFAMHAMWRKGTEKIRLYAGGGDLAGFRVRRRMDGDGT